jgi:Leucine-rich repeat (LRR) protein
MMMKKILMLKNENLEIFENKEEYKEKLEIYLDRNRLQKIELNHENLKVLSLGCNNLTEIPQLKYLQNLEELNLSSNKIKVMSKELLYLKKLKILDMKRNLIKKVENLESVSEGIEYLSMSCNSIDNLDNFPKMNNLVFLGLFANLFDDESVFDVVYEKTPNLKKIFIDKNPLDKKFDNFNFLKNNLVHLQFINQ